MGGKRVTCLTSYCEWMSEQRQRATVKCQNYQEQQKTESGGKP